MANRLPDHLKQELIRIKPDQIDLDFLSNNFGWRMTKKDGKVEKIPPKFHTGWHVHLEANEYINQRAVDTNCGIILFNKLMIEGRFEKLFDNHFYNEVIDKGKFNKFKKTIDDATRNKTIEINPTYVEFLKIYEFYGLAAVTIFSPSYSMNIIVPNKDVIKARDETVANLKGTTELTKMVEEEDKLVQLAKSKLKDDYGYSLYAAGARGSFDNDYKNISLALGPVQNLITGEFKYVKHNYINGMEREDLVSMGNSLVAAEYPKAVGTQKSGYDTKKFYALFQDLELAPPKSDCHSKAALAITITNSNMEDYMYQNIMEGEKIVNLDDETIKKYVGKTVRLRSPMFCTNKQTFCAACAGTRFYELEMTNPGLTSVKISNGLLNKRMKLRHNSKVKLNHAEPEKLLLGSKDGAKYFTKDAYNVYINSTCAELYIPESLFNKDDNENALYREDGQGFRCIGIANMRFFDDYDFTRETGKLYTLAFPSNITIYPTSSSVEKLTINGIEDKYRVMYFEKGDIVMPASGKQDPLNCELFISLLISGKIPNTINYPDVLRLWNLNFEINGYDPGVADVLKQMVIAKLYRDPNDYSKEFRLGAGSGKYNMTEYVTLNPRELTANSSVFAGLAFEDFGNALNSGLLMSLRNTEQHRSPIEEVIF